MGRFQFNLILSMFGFLTLLSGFAGLSGLLNGSQRGIPQCIIAAIIMSGLYYFLNGSDKARFALAFLSIFWFLVSLFLLFVIPASDFFPLGLINAILALVMAGCSYLLIFSQDLKQELVKRSQAQAQAQAGEN